LCLASSDSASPAPSFSREPRTLSRYYARARPTSQTNMNTDFDVIVVGAGPSGTAAAYRLKQAGRRMLLLDRQKFPRVKPCGGGLTIKTLALMPWSVAPVIERAVKTVRLGVTSGGSERSELFEADDHVCTFAVREEFDRFNLEKTIEGGVEFEQAALTEVDERPDFVRVGTGGKAMTTRYLIGADGANSTVRRLADGAKHFRRICPRRAGRLLRDQRRADDGVSLRSGRERLWLALPQG
jgi:flavin-dependent dehydrogenase